MWDGRPTTSDAEADWPVLSSPTAGRLQAVTASLRLGRADDALAALLLERCEKRSGPRPGDSQTEGLERLKTNYEESAYWQLKAVLQPEKP